MYERLGVPEGNVELAIDIYGFILSEFKKISNKPLFQNAEIDPSSNLPKEELELNFKGDRQIAGLPVNEVKINFKILKYKGDGEQDKGDFELVNANVAAGEKLSPGFINKRESIENFTINTTFVAEGGKDLTYGDFVKYLEKDTDMIVSTLSHEIKHIFDSTKKATKFSDLADYSGIESTVFNIPAINDFLFYLYNVHRMEDLVRPSEIASIIKKKGIKKKDFVNFLDQNHVVQKLRKIRDWSYEGMKKQLLKEVDIIKERLTDSQISFPEDDEQIVDIILDLLYINIRRNSASAFRHFYKELEKPKNSKDPFAFLIQLLGMPTESQYQKEIDDFIESRKYQDSNKFFLDQEKKIKTVSDKAIRKISKLYDLAEAEDLNLEEDKNSIVNMEIYHKVNGIKTNIKKFKDF